MCFNCGWPLLATYVFVHTPESAYSHLLKQCFVYKFVNISCCGQTIPLSQPHSLFWCLIRMWQSSESLWSSHLLCRVSVCLCVCVQSVFLDLKGKFESGEIDVSDSEEEGEGEGEAGGELDSAASDEDDGNVFRREKCNACMYVCMYMYKHTH